MPTTLDIVDYRTLSYIFQCYDDHEMVKEFSRMLDRCDEDLLDDSSVFVRLMMVVSCGSISESEVLSVYKKCVHSPKATGKKKVWKSAFSTIRKKLMISFLVTSIIDSRIKSEASMKSDSFPKQISSSLHAVGITSMRHSNVVRGEKKKKEQSSSLEKGCTDDTSMINDALRNQLNQSLQKYKQYDRRLSRSLVNLTTELSIEGHTNAVKYSKYKGCHHIYNIICNKRRKLLGLYWSKWIDSLKIWKLFMKCEDFLRLYSVALLMKFINDVENRKIRTWFQLFKGSMNQKLEEELHAAAITLQIFFRYVNSNGKHMKWRVEKACLRIQKAFRFCLQKMSKNKHVMEKKRRKAVRVIAEWWSCARWPRVLAQYRHTKRRNFASVTIQSHFRGFVAKRKYQVIAHMKCLHNGALKLQSLYRRFIAIKEVRELLRHVKYRKCTICIQSFFRKVAAAIEVDTLKRVRIAAVRLQCFFCYTMTKLKVHARRCKKSICILQTTYRGYRARRKIAIKMNVRTQAMDIITSRFLLRVCSQNWQLVKCRGNISEFHLILQYKLKAIILGQRVRKRFRLYLLAVHRIQEFLRKVKERNGVNDWRNTTTIYGSMTIQKLWRGYASRRNLKELVGSFPTLCPLYYQFKLEYVQLQNMYHKLHVVKIQSILRRRLAYAKVSKLRRNKCVKFIQSSWRSRMRIQRAREKLRNLKETQSNRIFAAIVLQSLARGIRSRIEYSKHFRAEEVKWFLTEIHATSMMGRALQQFRARKKSVDNANRAAVKIQNIMRGTLCRWWFHKNFNKLVRYRGKRRRMRTTECATIICSKFARVYLARKRVIKKRTLLFEHKLEKERLVDFEDSINSIHDIHLNTLYVMRMQSGVRLGLAKRKLKEDALINSNLKLQLTEEVQNLSAVKIQAIVRGVQYRVTYERLLPGLKAAKTARSYCTECENKVAKRRCRQCKDNFCVACYEIIHKKGTTLSHFISLLSSFSYCTISCRCKKIAWLEFGEYEGRS